MEYLVPVILLGAALWFFVGRPMKSGQRYQLHKDALDRARAILARAPGETRIPWEWRGTVYSIHENLRAHVSDTPMSAMGGPLLDELYRELETLDRIENGRVSERGQQEMRCHLYRKTLSSLQEAERYVVDDGGPRDPYFDLDSELEDIDEAIGHIVRWEWDSRWRMPDALIPEPALRERAAKVREKAKIRRPRTSAE